MITMEVMVTDDVNGHPMKWVGAVPDDITPANKIRMISEFYFQRGAQLNARCFQDIASILQQQAEDIEAERELLRAEAALEKEWIQQRQEELAKLAKEILRRQ